MRLKDASTCAVPDHDSLTKVPTDEVFAYTRDRKTVDALICFRSGHSIAYALVSEGVPKELPSYGDANLVGRIEALINQGSLIPFTEELAKLENFFHLRDPRPWNNHNFAVWHPIGRRDSLPSLVPGKVYGYNLDGCVPPDQVSDPPESIDLNELADLLAGDGVAIVTCVHDVPEHCDVIFCDMRLVLSRLVSA